MEGAKGDNAIQRFVDATGTPVYTVAGIREVVDYLYRERVPVLVHGERRPISDRVKKDFDQYLLVYGVD